MMAILRKANKDQYTTIPQEIFRDKRLSLKDIGLLVSLLSLPDNWHFSENGLEAIFEHDGQTSIRTGLKNLEKYGYLRRERLRNPDGKMGSVNWYLYDYPHFEKPQGEKPHCENPNWENQPQSITKEVNTNESITKEEKESRKKGSIDYLAIVNAYKEICVSLPQVRNLSDARKKAINARVRSGYTLDDFIKLFKKAQASDFLKGKNDRNWTATFDWLLKDSNMAKVLDGNYDNRTSGKQIVTGDSWHDYKLKGAIEI